ncbi:YccF domain-containing protein [Glaciimonas soli]|uniref:Inner membrane protein YccF n=1 Tax=Glaciimonas soli TaxID=2590999 RepID=A0A843YR77_9BURK|nr:YccF domain-containing protein [Glaciimonas soli]MQR00234.1 YccF domain-containing protein [Glaciimonas soli]
MRTTGNFLWFVLFGGFWMWLLWLAASLLAFISIIGIPWGRSCWNLASLAAAPFGNEAIDRQELTQKSDIGTSFLGSLGNIIWFIVVGFWLAGAHLVCGLASCITVIGIPFGLQHFKLAGLSMMPIGKAIVSAELAKAAREENARINLERVRSGTKIFDIKKYEE